MPSKPLIQIASLILLSCAAVVALTPSFGGGHDSHVRAEESAALATLRQIAGAQFRVQESCTIDVDGDGLGEFANYGELTAREPLRSTGEPMSPPQLRFSFDIVNPSGVFKRAGYCYRIFLPGSTQDNKLEGLHEGLQSEPDPDAAENYWSIYAWPSNSTGAAERTFFLNQEGLILQTVGGYFGSSSPPRFDAALSRKQPESLAAPLGINGQPSNDGRPWSQVPSRRMARP